MQSTMKKKNIKAAMMVGSFGLSRTCQHIQRTTLSKPNKLEVKSLTLPTVIQ